MREGEGGEGAREEERARVRPVGRTEGEKDWRYRGRRRGFLLNQCRGDFSLSPCLLFFPHTLLPLLFLSLPYSSITIKRGRSGWKDENARGREREGEG
jgi:hypothetical protein